MGLNFYSLAIAISILTKRLIVPGLPKIYLFLFALSLLGINSYYFYGTKRYLKIEKRYENESEKERNKGVGILIIYILISVTLVISLLIILSENLIAKTQ
jgi:hypothetical protein